MFGKDKQTGKYVCKNIDSRGIAHFLIIGGSGSGKSSGIIIPTLLASKDNLCVVLDIKSELSLKTARYSDMTCEGHTCVINPNDRSMYGYDPMYELNSVDDPTTQQIVATWQQIAVCFVSKSPNEKDPYWSDSARNMLQGLGIYYYKLGIHEFVDIIDKILGSPITEQITEALKKTKPMSPEYRYLIQFGDLTDDKGKVTLGTIYSNLANHITLFANDPDLRFQLKTNPRRASPYTVFHDRKSVYISLKEEKLEVYAGLLKLMIDQMLREAERQPDISGGSGESIIFAFDELPRILAGAGKLQSILSGLKTLRSKGVILMMVTQSVSALQQAYSREEVDDLINNCEYIEILSAKDPTTAKMVSTWCGKYNEKSINRQSGREKSSSLSYIEKPIITEDELITLQQSGEAILISPYGWNRIIKTPYYRDKAFEELSKKIETSNKEFKEVK